MKQKTVFVDPFYVDFYDPDHSADEERYVINEALRFLIRVTRENQLALSVTSKGA